MKQTRLFRFIPKKSKENNQAQNNNAKRIRAGKISEPESDGREEVSFDEKDDGFQPITNSVKYDIDGVEMIKALNGEGTNALLESPTGSGKSMAIICGALGWLEHKKREAMESARKSLELWKSHDEMDEIARLNEENASDNMEEFISVSNNYRGKMTNKPGEGKEKDQNEELNTLAKLGVPKIYICSRTHKQIAQLIRELRRTSYSPKFVVLGSRAHYCINDLVKKREKEINEGCRDLLKEKKCEFFSETTKWIKKQGESYTADCDIEDLVGKGRRNGVCPYYVSRGSVANAEVVFSPYNYLIDPTVREAMNIELGRDIIIVDEAHNIEDVCRDAASFEVTDDVLVTIQLEVNTIINKIQKSRPDLKTLLECHITMGHVLGIFNNWIHNGDLVRASVRRDFELQIAVFAGNNLIEELRALCIDYEAVSSWGGTLRRLEEEAKRTEERESTVDEKGEPIKFLSTGSLRILASMFFALMNVLFNNNYYLSSYRMIKYQMPKVIEGGQRRMVSTFGLWCLNPEVIFKKLSNDVKSIILTSGTLSPMDTFSAELGAAFEQRLEALHIIDESQTWVGCIPTGPFGATFLGNYKTMDSFDFQDDIARSILKVIKLVPGGILVFVPSYAFLDKLLNRVKVIGIYDEISRHKKIFLEPKQGAGKDFDRLMKSFYKLIRDCSGKDPSKAGLSGGIMFAVYRGKISEGLDLRDDNCRAVIPIGIPYPAFKDPKVVLKKEFNDAGILGRRLFSGQRWYESQAFRALNQALGRCIRHRKDWGAVILLEQRFTQSRNVEQLSKWVRGRLRPYQSFDLAMESLGNFVQFNLKLMQVGGGAVKAGCDEERVENVGFNQENYHKGIIKANIYDIASSISTEKEAKRPNFPKEARGIGTDDSITDNEEIIPSKPNQSLLSGKVPRSLVNLPSDIEIYE